MEINKCHLKIELGFISKLFNSLIEIKAPKLWEEQNVQGSTTRWVLNIMQLLE